MGSYKFIKNGYLKLANFSCSDLLYRCINYVHICFGKHLKSLTSETSCGLFLNVAVDIYWYSYEPYLIYPWTLFVCVSMDDSKFSMDGCFLEVGFWFLCVELVGILFLRAVSGFYFSMQIMVFFLVIESGFLILCWIRGLLFFFLFFPF